MTLVPTWKKHFNFGVGSIKKFHPAALQRYGIKASWSNGSCPLQVFLKKVQLTNRDW